MLSSVEDKVRLVDDCCVRVHANIQSGLGLGSALQRAIYGMFI